MATIELDDETAQIIVSFCDMAAPNFTAKYGGLAYFNALNKVLSILPKPKATNQQEPEELPQPEDRNE